MRYYSTLFLYFIITVFVSFNVLSSECKKPVMPSNDEWQVWLSEIKKEALKEGISQNIIDAARDFEVENVIHTSTSEVYGTAKFVPITEEHPLQGQSPYSASKIGADQIAMSYYSSYKLPITILRPFNTYGPRQSIRAVIPTIIFQILKGKNSINLGSLNPTRDFSFVDDTVEAFVKAAKSKKIDGDIINIGSNFEISIKDTAKIMSFERLPNENYKF